MDSIYSFPQYYEIAYSYRDLKAEADVLEEAISKYSRIPVKTVLELACGNSPHMPELISRGYEYQGLDISPTMIEFSRAKAAELGSRPRFYQKDLTGFQLEESPDFIYILMGSLYVKNTAELLSHFRCVEKALKPGGLYFLDWCIDFSPLDYDQDRWVMRRGSITVETHYITRLHHAAEQLYKEEITFMIREKGRRRRLVHSGLRRAIFPQEFILAATKLNRLEFLGWWNDWDWDQPLRQGQKEIVRPIALLRRP